jgi:hypothetical protein
MARWAQDNKSGDICMDTQGNFNFASPTHAGSFFIDAACALGAVRAQTYIHGVKAVIVVPVSMKVNQENISDNLLFIPVVNNNQIYFGTAIDGGPTLVIPYECIDSMAPTPDEIK